jgi:ATP-dependent 26S proteasome regulatory subunit
MTTLTIMRLLPREVDPLVYNMTMEDPGGVSFAGIGGLSEQIRELREASELVHASTGIPGQVHMVFRVVHDDDDVCR